MPRVFCYVYDCIYNRQAVEHLPHCSNTQVKIDKQQVCRSYKMDFKKVDEMIKDRMKKS